jgi:hypothetical protein
MVMVYMQSPLSWQLPADGATSVLLGQQLQVPLRGDVIARPEVLPPAPVRVAPIPDDAGSVNVLLLTTARLDRAPDQVPEEHGQLSSTSAPHHYKAIPTRPTRLINYGKATKHLTLLKMMLALLKLRPSPVLRIQAATGHRGPAQQRTEHDVLDGPAIAPHTRATRALVARLNVDVRADHDEAAEPLA